MLAAVGDLLEDIVVRLASEPTRGTDTPAVIERRRGGSAANVAAAAATLGAEVRFIGRVGADPLGDRLVSELLAAGVDVRVQRSGRTGSVVVLVGPDGERTMLPDRGAAVDLCDVDPTWTAGVSWLHVPSYSLVGEPVGAAAVAILEAVRANAGRVSIDASSVALLGAHGRDRYAALIARLAPDVVFANVDEAPYVPPGRWTTIVKRGPEPVTVSGPEGAFDVPVPDLGHVDDTTGAGDAFAAGYVVAAMNGADRRAAVEAGIDLAAHHVLNQTTPPLS